MTTQKKRDEDKNAWYEKYAERNRQAIENGEMASITLLVDSKINTMIKGIAKSLGLHKAEVMRNLLWKGFMQWDREREAEGKESLSVLFENFQARQAEQIEKDMVKQLKKENRKYSEFILGIKKEND